jgi:hypothetical protein
MAAGSPGADLFEADDLTGARAAARRDLGVARELHPGVFVRSFYFRDPDGVVLAFACWRRVMGRPGDVWHEPKTAADRTGV